MSSPPLIIGQVVCDPPVVLAPMAAVTNPPFRLICRRMGAGLVVTEMISAKGLVHGGKKTMSMLDVRADEHPVSVQIFGHDPKILAAGAAVVEDAGADMVDVNMGCPSRKVVRSGHGAALLRNPRTVYDIVSAMVETVDIPVTVKIRAGFENAQPAAIGRAVEDAGGAAIAIHGRTKTDGFEGHADLEQIKALVDAVDIPVIGNGDVRDASSALSMMEETGCQGVMVARGCMGYPFVFQEIAAAMRGEPLPPEPSLQQRQAVVREHVSLYAATYGERRTCLEIRKHLLWYFRKTPGETVIKRQMANLATVQAIFDAVERAVEACDAPTVTFCRGLERHPNRRNSKRR